MTDPLPAALQTLPECLRDEARDHWQALLEAAPEAAAALGRADLVAAVLRVWAGSEFIARACLQDPELLTGLAVSGDLHRPYADGEFQARAQQATAPAVNAPDLARRLRRLRLREAVRIGFRDLAGWTDLDETLAETTALAESLIRAALDRHQHWFSERHGAPHRPGAGRPMALLVLGMGKLGGGELNFSSDIDLIFGYAGAGQGDGENGLAAEQYFTRLGRALIDSLQQRSSDGYCYRVDMRLRPFGDAGPLAMSLPAMEGYYESQGREWERYALLKAAPICGDEADIQAFEAIRRPFVYRRYLDYGSFERLREMKASIEAEHRRRGSGDNIKTGPGGIREVEFIAQAFQLVRGGREPRLRSRSLLATLPVLRELGLIPATAEQGLTQAYRYLRRVENRLQAWRDEQTHRLPPANDRLAWTRLALTLGEVDAAAAQQAMTQHRAFIHAQFEQVFAAPQQEDAAGGGVDPLVLAWQQGDAQALAAALTGLDYDDPAEAARRLLAVREGLTSRVGGANGRERLRRLMPLLLRAVAGVEHPTETLSRLLPLLEAIAGRSAYLALLVERPLALSQLVQLAAASPWIAKTLARHPLLLDELIDPRSLYQPLAREALEQDLGERLRDLDPDDLEAQMEALRQFRNTQVLRVAAADVAGATPLMVVSDRLTDIAEVVLNHALELAWRHLVARHGRPRSMVDGERRAAGFAVVGYGKLGGIELSYGSDLDLVFLHDSSEEAARTDGPQVVDNPVFFARLGQRLVHILSARTPSGSLYEIDTRLRPSGSAGLLVTSLAAFQRYQDSGAWTWEHQALTRARCVAGDDALCWRFEQLRSEVLCRPREAAALRGEVRAMREKMRGHLGRSGPGQFDLKQDAGGIADIEFMVQYLVLRHAAAHPGLVRHSDNIRQLDALAQAGILSPSEAESLAEIYRRFRARGHREALQERPAVVDAGEFASQRSEVRALWARLMFSETDSDNSQE